MSDLVTGAFTEAREEVASLARSVGLPTPLNVQQWTRTYDLLRRNAEAFADNYDTFAAIVDELDVR